MTKQQATARLPKEAKPLQRRIEHWRRTRRVGMPMPEELWVAAAALARKHGTYEIARGLPVDYGALKKRVQACRHAVATDESTDAGASAVGTTFVELDAARIFGGVDVTGPVVELARPDGARLVVRLPGGVSLDVAGLAIAFCGGGA